MKPAPTKLNALRVDLVQHVIEAQAIANRLQRVNAKLAEQVLKQIDALALVIRSQHGAGNGDLELFFNFPSTAKLPGLDADEMPTDPDSLRTYAVTSKPRVFDAEAFARSMAVASAIAQKNAAAKATAE